MCALEHHVVYWTAGRSEEEERGEENDDENDDADEPRRKALNRLSNIGGCLNSSLVFLLVKCIEFNFNNIPLATPASLSLFSLSLSSLSLVSLLLNECRDRRTDFSREKEEERRR